jgi:hypothetical protein
MLVYLLDGNYELAKQLISWLWHHDNAEVKPTLMALFLNMNGQTKRLRLAGTTWMEALRL